MKYIAVLILAAGNASRMGSIKQLLPYKNTTILQIVIKNALASKANKVCCVLGAHSEVIKSKIETDTVTFIENPNWESGLSSSIVEGISYLRELDEKIDAVLILLADQPHVETNYINKLIDVFEINTNKIVASAYSNVKGVPAIFPSNSFDNLLKLEGDKGAKSFLNSPNQNIISVGLKSSNVLKDIDTLEDYEDFLKNS